MQGEMSKSAIIVRNSKIFLSIAGRTSRQRICKSLEDSGNIINQLGLTDIYRTHYPTTPAESTFFSSAERIFITIYHIPGYHTNLKKF